MTPDLSTRYLGFQLRNPFVVSASPLGRDLDRLLLLEAAGASAVVLPSLFEEQIEHDTMQVHTTLEQGTESFPEALSYLPEMSSYNTGPERYLSLITRAREALRIPVIPSLNGASPGGWTSYARKMQDAGAHALELNVYFIAADMEETSEQAERRYLDIVTEVRRAITIPLAVKVGPSTRPTGWPDRSKTATMPLGRPGTVDTTLTPVLTPTLPGMNSEGPNWTRAGTSRSSPNAAIIASMAASMGRAARRSPGPRYRIRPERSSREP